MSSHVEAAARLLAERQRRDRSTHPTLPVALETVDATMPLVRRAFLSESTRGVVADLGGEIVGFLLGQRTAFPPDSTIAPSYFAASVVPHLRGSGNGGALLVAAWIQPRRLATVAYDRRACPDDVISGTITVRECNQPAARP